LQQQQYSLNKIEDALSRHENIVFMFSGGKDSLACLFLLKPYLHKINVIWVNTSNFFPENIELVKKHTKDLPKFIEIKTDVNTFKKMYGMPTDILPTGASIVAQSMNGESGLRLVSGYDCCASNMWIPAFNKTVELGVTLIIRGQRNEESTKSPLRSGNIDAGIEMLFPIEKWLKQDVLDYLASQGEEVPEWFDFTESSLDCINCTAFLSGIADRREYMEKYHNIEHRNNNANIRNIIDIVEKSLLSIKDYLQ